jgi:hypothetical protein
MIPYEQLAAILERRARGEQAASSASAEDNTLTPAPGDHSTEYEIGEVLTDEESGG